MTSPSRKSRRITAWSTAILISWSSGAVAQTRPDAPAPTAWQPYVPPSGQPAAMVPAPIAPPVMPMVPSLSRTDLPPLPPLPAMPKTVMFQKPQNEMRPQMTPPRELVTTPAAVAPPRMPPVQPVQAMAPASTPQAPVIARPAVMVRPQTPNPKDPPAKEPKPGESKAETLLMSTAGALPSQEELFRLDSDATLDSRILKDLAKTNDKFPPARPLVPANTPYVAKTFNYMPTQLLREPNYVIHRRLYFEEMNSERGMWDAGPFQGVISSAYFYRDVLLFPGKMASGCKTPFDASAGKCMPGDPTPYYYYPPSDTTLFGGVVGATVITGAAIILP